MAKILCPFHGPEKTPSLEVYADGYYCFGCQASGPLSDLGRLDFVPTRKPAPVDVASELARISALPKARVRGLELPVDRDGYYIVWTGASYFKFRKFIADDTGKYRCPRGHKKPLFVARAVKGDTCALVEGEINALSLAATNPPYSVVSPGGVADFSEKLLDTPELKGYTKWILVLDKDEPGFNAAVKMRGSLLKRTPFVQVKLVQPDLNDMLVNGTIKEETKNWGW